MTSTPDALPAIPEATGLTSKMSVEERRESFARMLRYELKEQGRTRKWLAEQIGAEPAGVRGWARGVALPRYDSMLAIAEVLMSGRLRRLATLLCGTVCPCGVWFIDNTNGLRKTYHNKDCQRTFENRTQRERQGEKRASLAAFKSKRLHLYQGVVHQMCTQWCPNDGFCPDASCPAQVMGVSPYKPIKEGRRNPAAKVLL